MDAPEHGSHPQPAADERGHDSGRLPERAPTGWPITFRWMRATAVIVLCATLVLTLVLVFARG